MSTSRPRFKACKFCGEQARRANSGGIVGAIDYVCSKDPHHVETLAAE